MMFSSRPTHDLRNLTFGGGTIEWVDEFKYLGLTISNKLSFAKHVDRIALNISRITGAFTNLRTIFPLNIMMKLYYALAYPHLNNHIILWGSAPQTHLKMLIIRLNNMLRVIFGVRWENWRPIINTNVLYKSNGLLNVNSIFKYSLYKMLKQLLEGKLPELYSILLEPHLTLHSYSTRGGRFRHPALVCEVERRALPHQLIKLHDDLPSEMLGASLRCFKAHILNNQ